MTNYEMVTALLNKQIEVFISECTKFLNENLENGGIAITKDGLFKEKFVSDYKVTDHICNFFVAVKSIDRRIGSQEKSHEITLLVCPRSDPAKLTEITLPISKLANIRWIAEKLGGKYACYNYRELKKVIYTFAEHAPENTLYAKNGWHNNCYVTGRFIIGDHESNERPSPNARLLNLWGINEPLTKINGEYEFNTVHTKSDAENKNEQNQKGNDAYLEKEIINERQVLEALFKCTKEIPVSFLLYLNLVLSFMKTPLSELNAYRIPQFLTILVAPSMAGKTTLLKTELCCYEDIELFDLSVGVSEAAIFSELEYFSDAVLPIDDFKLRNGDNSDLYELVETLIRACGNAGSSRKTAKGSSSVSGMAIMTAEMIPEVSESSLNRIIVLQMKRENVDFEKIEFVNDHRNWYARHIYRLIEYIATKGVEKIAKALCAAFEKNLKELENYPQRRAEAYSWLISAFQCIVEPYCKHIGLDLNQQAYQIADYAKNALEDYAIELQESDPVNMLAQYLKSYGDDLFTADDGVTKPDANKLGLKSANNIFYITEEGFTRLKGTLGIKISSRSFAERLKCTGLLEPDGKRSNKKRKTIKGETLLFYKIILQNYGGLN